MQIAQSSSSMQDPIIEVLKLMSDPDRFKDYVKKLEVAKKAFNKAKKSHDDVLAIAKTVADADAYCDDKTNAVHELEARQHQQYEDRKAGLDAREVSVGRREGAHKRSVSDEQTAVASHRQELRNGHDALGKREQAVSRHEKRLAKLQQELRNEKDALDERAGRIAAALKP